MNLNLTKEQKTMLLWGIAFLVVLAAMLIPQEAWAVTANNAGNKILMSREQIKAAGGGVDQLASNTVGGLNTTTLKALYSFAYIFGVGFFFVGIIVARKQTQQPEEQRKWLFPIASMIFGVALAGFTTAFGLMSDTMGFGSFTGGGVDSSINMEAGKTGIGIGKDSQW